LQSKAFIFIDRDFGRKGRFFNFWFCWYFYCIILYCVNFCSNPEKEKEKPCSRGISGVFSRIGERAESSLGLSSVISPGISGSNLSAEGSLVGEGVGEGSLGEGVVGTEFF
jgi:hypothetical protein